MPFSALDLLVVSLATWRLASLLVNEDGPGRLFARLRTVAGIQTITTVTRDGLQTGYTATNPLAAGLLCVWCTSVWCAAFWLALWRLPVLAPVVHFVALLLAASALSILLHELIQHLRG